MKFYFTIFFICFFSQLSFSQNIIKDETTQDGHFITTSPVDVFSSSTGENGKLSLGVAFNNSMRTFFSLNLMLGKENDLSIPQGASLQLITFDGGVIVLHNSIGVGRQVSADGNNVLVVSYGLQYNEKELVDLDKIMNERIVKIRLETSDGVIERPIEDNRFSVAVHSCFVVLKDYLENLRI